MRIIQLYFSTDALVLILPNIASLAITPHSWCRNRGRGVISVTAAVVKEGNRQAESIHQEMPFAPLDPFVRVEAADAG